MTDRISHFTVGLTDNMREDDAIQICNAIQMIKGVSGVIMNLANPQEHIIKERAKRELRAKIYNLLD